MELKEMEIKERIITQAGSLFIKHGIRRISMDEIASSLGISKRTIYENFKDKEDLLLQYLRHFEETQSGYMRELSKKEKTVVHVFLKVIEMYKDSDFLNIRFINDVEKYYPKVKQELIDQQTRGIISTEKFLKEGVKQGVIRDDLNIEIVSFLLHDSHRMFVNAVRLTNKSFSNWDLFFTSMINFIRGISTASGLEIIDTFLTKYYSDINV